ADAARLVAREDACNWWEWEGVGTCVLVDVRGKVFYFFFSSGRRHTRCLSDWSSDVCSSDLPRAVALRVRGLPGQPDAGRDGAARRARGSDQGERRRRGDSVPDDPAGDGEHRGPRQATAPRGGAERPHRGAPESSPPRDDGGRA